MHAASARVACYSLIAVCMVCVHDCMCIVVVVDDGDPRRARVRALHAWRDDHLKV